MAPEPESGFMIDDRIYEAPFFGDLDIDEWEVVYGYCGLTLEDILPADPDADADEQAAHEATVDEKTRHPGFKKALLHIAYQRGNPDVKPARVTEIVGKVKLIDAFLSALPEDDVGPPELTSEPAASSPRSELDSTDSSSSPSPNGSDLQDDDPEATGTIRSDTPALRLAQGMSGS